MRLKVEGFPYPMDRRGRRSLRPSPSRGGSNASRPAASSRMKLSSATDKAAALYCQNRNAMLQLLALAEAARAWRERGVDGKAAGCLNVCSTTSGRKRRRVRIFYFCARNSLKSPDSEKLMKINERNFAFICFHLLALASRIFTLWLYSSAPGPLVGRLRRRRPRAAPTRVRRRCIALSAGRGEAARSMRPRTTPVFRSRG